MGVFKVGFMGLAIFSRVLLALFFFFLYIAITINMYEPALVMCLSLGSCNYFGDLLRISDLHEYKR